MWFASLVLSPTARLSSTQHLKDLTCKNLELQMWLHYSLPHLIYILPLQRCTCEHTHVQYIHKHVCTNVTIYTHTLCECKHAENPQTHTPTPLH